MAPFLTVGRSFSALKATAMPPSEMKDEATKNWQINLLYDGKCSLCMKEVSFLQKRDMENAILFTDLNDPEYKPQENGGVDYEAGRLGGVGLGRVGWKDLYTSDAHSFPFLFLPFLCTGMKRIHAVLPDGKVVEGVEVFRRVYDVIGLGWVYAATKLPVVGTVVDKAYGKPRAGVDKGG